MDNYIIKVLDASIDSFNTYMKKYYDNGYLYLIRERSVGFDFYNIDKCNVDTLAGCLNEDSKLILFIPIKKEEKDVSTD